MIKVNIYQNAKKEYVGFKAKGHAGMADEGQDIVCAAASVLMMNTINAIELYTKDEASCISDDMGGFIDYQLTSRPTQEAALLLKTMVLGLESIEDEENYEKYIDIIFEEV